MDGERVNSSSDETDGTGRGGSDPTLTYTKVFNDWFPYYLSIGMSAKEYWQGDVFLVKAYRQAHKLREERMNTQCWLQGMYMYEALCDVSPIFNPYAKRGTKPHPYPTQPYQIHAPSKEEQDHKERDQMEKMKKAMDMFATRTNARIRKIEEVSK